MHVHPALNVPSFVISDAPSQPAKFCNDPNNVTYIYTIAAWSTAHATHTLAVEGDVLLTVKVNTITGNPLFLESSGIQGLKASMCTVTGTSPLV